MLTEQQRSQLDWEKTDGLMPAIVQHAVSGEVLMLGYMNPDALDKTLETGKVTFFSRTKQRLWTKGETSGNFLNVVSIAPDRIGDIADMCGTRNLRSDPQSQQQDRLHQHAEHRFTTGTDRCERAAGIKSRDRKEETGNSEQINQRDQIRPPP